MVLYHDLPDAVTQICQYRWQPKSRQPELKLVVGITLFQAPHKCTPKGILSVKT